MRNLPIRRLPWVTAAAAVVLIGAAPSPTAAQCAFDRTTETGSRTAYYFVSFVPAFVSCGNIGGNSPNTTTQGGVPGCAPPETFNQRAGSPLNGWRFSQQPSQSYARLRVSRYYSGLASPVRDIRFRLDMKKIIDGNHGFPSTSGNLEIVMRITTADPVYGDQTVVDFPLTIPFKLANGEASLDTSLAKWLARIGQPPFPDCSIVEIVSARILDPNGTVFAVPGARINS